MDYFRRLSGSNHNSTTCCCPPNLSHDSVASKIPVVIALDSLVTIGTCTTLARQLRNTKDLFGLSVEIQRAGFFMLASLGKRSSERCSY